jgi:hypothetical protein
MAIGQSMKQYLNKQTKQILSDPITEFSLKNPEADGNVMSSLTELHQQTISLKDQHNKITTQAKIISKKIGEAKRSSHDTKHFKVSMREHSSQLKHINEKINDIERLILQFFELNEHLPDDNETPAKNASNKTPPDRQYTDSIGNPKNINITLLSSEDNEWNAYVSKQPTATLHHLAEWRNLLQKSYGHESFYFLARDNSQ